MSPLRSTRLPPALCPASLLWRQRVRSTSRVHHTASLVLTTASPLLLFHSAPAWEPCYNLTLALPPVPLSVPICQSAAPRCLTPPAPRIPIFSHSAPAWESCYNRSLSVDGSVTSLAGAWNEAFAPPATAAALAQLMSR